MNKYIDADKLKTQIQFLIDSGYDNLQGNLYHVLSIITSLQQEESDMGEVSDGYHTFNELYYYRMLYYS